MTRTTSRSGRTILLTGGSLLLVSVLAMAIFSTLSGPLQITGIQNAFAQTGNQTSGNATATGNQTSSRGGGDMDQGDPDGDGL